MATDWAARTRALAYFEQCLKDSKRFNDDDRDHLEQAVNALRRSQDHTAIQAKLNVTTKALRELAESAELETGSSWPQLEAAQAVLSKPVQRSIGACSHDFGPNPDPDGTRCLKGCGAIYQQ